MEDIEPSRSESARLIPVQYSPLDIVYVPLIPFQRLPPSQEKERARMFGSKPGHYVATLILQLRTEKPLSLFLVALPLIKTCLRSVQYNSHSSN